MYFWFLQDQADPGENNDDEATYENLGDPPRCVEDTADTGVHCVTVHQLSKLETSGQHVMKQGEVVGANLLWLCSDAL